MRKKYRNSSRIADNAMRSTQNGVLHRNTAVFAGIGANGLSGIVPAVGRHWSGTESVTAASDGKEEKHKLREFVKSGYRFRNGGNGDVGNGSLKPKMHMDPNAAYPLATRDFTQDLIKELALEAVKKQRKRTISGMEDRKFSSMRKTGDLTIGSLPRFGTTTYCMKSRRVCWMTSWIDTNQPTEI